MIIDIMVPFWERNDWLAELIDSVLAQTDGRWRLVIVDDCHPNSDAERIVARANDRRIEYVRNPRNLGLRANFQRCVELATADYLVIPGNDDRFLPNYVATMQQAIAELHPDIVQPGVQVIDADGRRINGPTERIKALIRPRHLKARQKNSGQQLAVSLMRGNWLYWPSLLLRREAIASHPFRDFMIMLDLALVVDVLVDGGNLVVLEEEVFEYRRSIKSVSGRSALDGARFADEAAYYALAREIFDSRGWNKAARAARWHLTSRAHAFLLIPHALRSRKKHVLSKIVGHVVR
ncbi:glycosyl transferase [Trueperella pyogenes]|uniref:glycosyltransferase family 2 protein n=1 Tax=Trueperella pyogenes TaxID=1661 RepID=UPI00043ABBAA|nr:glycosyltransferase family 2 protein [Trueperella pyogenes]AHU89033.1 glycosyl transferase [Trueperella pyogenes]OQD39135.1 hypothetical protein B1R42_03265 [Trueperella pyogenes]